MSTNIESLRAPAPAPQHPVALGETAASAVAARAKAMVLAHYEMALRQPRNDDAVRQNLLKECRRPSFANNKSALYRKPVGEGVEGLGIRFVEVALRCMKNVLVETSLVFEDDEKEVHNVSVVDLESNTPYSTDVKVSKTVERSKPLSDGTFISVRKNSGGRDVYTVPATDDDLLNKRAALLSKAIRTLGLRMIPGDLQDEAEDIIRKVRKDDAARDPDAARKAMVDAFGELGVKVDMLEEYLGHPIAETTPDEIVELRGFYGSIKDGETSWRAIMEHRREDPNWKPSRKKDAKDAADLKQATQQGAAGAPAAAPAQQQTMLKSAIEQVSEQYARKVATEQTQPAEPKKEEPAKAEAQTAEQRAAIQAAQPKTRPVVTERGRILTEITYEPKIGDHLEVNGYPWRIFEVTDKQCVARPAEDPKPQAGEASAIELQTVLSEIMGAEDQADVKSCDELIAKLPEKDQQTARALLETKKAQLGGSGRRRRGGGSLE